MIERCHPLKHRKGCCKSRPLCRYRRKPQLCRCAGVTWNSKRPGPHRKGSKCGKFGTCEHHPAHAADMYKILDTPVRRVR